MIPVRVTCCATAADRAGSRARSGRDRLHQRLDAEDIDHSLHIVGQHLQAHLGFDLFEGPGQEVSAAHPCLERAERMLDGLPADCHGLRHVVEPGLHLCRARSRAPSASGV